MKLIKSAIDARTQSGSVTLLPTVPEDMWCAYNLLSPGDRLRASAIRRVVTESASTGSSTSSRVHTTLTLAITSLDFDARASQLHVSGRVAAENPLVKLGQYHTLDLELNRNFSLDKSVDSGGWDSVALQALRDACADPATKAEVWALLIDDGLASLCVVGDGTTVLRQTVSVRLGSKDSPGYTSALTKFYRRVLDTLLRALDTSLSEAGDELKPVLVAGVGYAGQKFVAVVREAAASSGGKGQAGSQGKKLRQLLAKIVLERASGASMASLREVLASPGVQKRLADSKFARETAALDAVFTRMREGDVEGSGTKVAYGSQEVLRAVEAGAVGKGGGVLLISDELFRSVDVATRKKWVALVDRVRGTEGGEVRVLSSMHESGARLKGIGDVAALLTFPIFEDEDDDDGQGKGRRGHVKPAEEGAGGDDKENRRPWRPADDGLPEIEM